MRHADDTIAAIATAQTPAAIGIVRISGVAAREIAARVLRRSPSSLRPRRVIGGRAHNAQSLEPIDEVLAFYCPGPKTATGEDIAELQGHGGPLVLGRILQATIKHGARPADRGEFTYRAFLNGRLDLVQAEAVMSLIGARSARAAQVAMHQLGGEATDALAELFSEVLDILAPLEAGLDFPDEDIPTTQMDRHTRRLSQVAARLESILTTHNLGRHLEQGARVAIVGPPNAGKSSLFNRLLGSQRALVDHRPGTTRDVVQASTLFGDIPVTLFDTAGVREDANRIERDGIQMGLSSAATADLVLVVLDTANMGHIARADINKLEGLLSRVSCEQVLVLNKCDLPGFTPPDELPIHSSAVIAVSARTGEGLEELLAIIERRLGRLPDKTPQTSSALVLTSARQYALLSSCLSHIENGIENLEFANAPELAAEDLGAAANTLGEVLGKRASDEMLDVIFSKFCIGK